MEGNEINSFGEGSSDDQKRDSPSPNDRLESVRTSTPKGNISIDSAVTVREFELETIGGNAHVFVNDEFAEEEGHVGGAGEAMKLDNVYENNQIMPRQSADTSRQTYPLHVPCLTCLTLFSCPEELKLHCNKIHRNNSQELFEMSMCNKGLISCQLCGILQEWNIDSVFTHCLNAHGNSPKSYLEQGFQQQTEFDKRASDMASSLKCPHCQNGASFQGIRAWISHYQQVHREPEETDDSLIGMVADQLGNGVATRCRRCKAAVSVALAHKHLGIDCQPGNVKRKDTNFESQNTCRAIKGYKVHDVTIALKCPLCTVTLKKLENLQQHYQKAHQKSPLHFLQQSILESSGIISCRVCFVVTRRHPQWLVGHVRNHHLNLSKYCFLFGRSLKQSEREEEASRLTASVKCPLCDRAALASGRKNVNSTGQTDLSAMTLFQLHSHLKEAHKKGVTFDKLLFLVADQLNLDSCNLCERAVAQDREGKRRHVDACHGGQWMMPLKAKLGKDRKRDTQTDAKASKYREKEGTALPSQVKDRDEYHARKKVSSVEKETTSRANGLLTCRFCWCVRKANRSSIRLHLKKCHNVEYQKHLKAPDQPFVRNSEVKNGSKALNSIQCPTCKKGGLVGLREYRKHLIKSHGCERLSLTFNHIMYQLAPSLGFGKCSLCQSAILLSKAREHRAFHRKKDSEWSLWIGNRNVNLEHCQQEEASSHPEADGPTKDLMQGLQSISKMNTSDFMSIAISTSPYPFISTHGEEPFMRLLGKETGIPQPSNTERSSKSNVSVAFQGPSKEKVTLSKTSLPAPEVPTKANLGLSIIKEKRTDEDSPMSNNPTKDTLISKKEKGPRRVADKVLWRKSSTTTENFIILWLALLRPRCPFCKDVFHSDKEIEKHLRLKHAREYHVSNHQKRGKAKEMACDLCSKTITADLDSLRFHLAKEHARKSMDCTSYLRECGLTFVGQKKLKYPLLMHLCPWCDKSLPSIAELRAHADAEHIGGKDGFLLDLFQTAFSGLFFGCPLCDKRIDMSYNAVETHVNVRHLGMDASRFLQLFYKTIKLEWQKQVFGKDEIGDVRKSKGNSLTSENSKATTSSSLNTFSDLDSPIDVIDLCSDDEEAAQTVSPQDKQGKNESQDQLGKQDVPLDLSLSNKANVRKARGEIPSVKKANLSPLQASSADREETSAITKSESTCTYTCPKCKMGGFSSLSLAASHIKRIHNGHVESLAALKTSRIERYTTCKICGEKILSDKVEVGYHLWSVHNLPLEAYDSL